MDPFDADRPAFEHLLRSIGDSFTSPDDDWKPILIAQTPRGVKFHEVDPIWISSSDRKEFLYRVILPNFLKQWRATRAAFAMSMWYKTVSLPRENMKEHEIQNMPQVRQMSEHGVRSMPDKKEGIFMTFIDRVHERTYIADIRRTGSSPPTLDQFHLFNQAVVSGRVVEGIRKALR